MNLESIHATYYEYSGKASDIARQLCFAGIALIWIFKQEKGAPLDVPGLLLIPAWLFVLALALDLIQYAAASAIWSIYGRCLEGRNTPSDQDIDAPMWFNWPTLVCYWLKLVFVVLAYIQILQYIQSLLTKP